MITRKILLVWVMLFCSLSNAGVDLDNIQGKFVQVSIDNVSVGVHYKVVGEGNFTTVLLHGAACDITFWVHQLDVLMGLGKVILIDLPGHGESDRPRIEYSLASMARAVNAVFVATATKQAAFVSHSMGVRVSREFYSEWPEKMQALIAVDGPVYRNPSQAIVDQYRDAPNIKSHWYQMVDSMTNTHTPEALREKVNRVMKGTPDWFVRRLLMSALSTEAITEEVKFDVPVLVIRRDFYTMRENEMRENLKSKISSVASYSNVIFLRGDLSHFLMAERPDMVNPLLLKFLKKL